MGSILEIRPDLKAELDHLAAETHRSESELANEALVLYLARERHTLSKIKEGLAQAQRDEFVPDAEMDAFFAQYGEPGA